jgi:hypothetical protein
LRSKLALRWQVVDELAQRIWRHLRPLYATLDFSGIVQDTLWLAALTWVKGVCAQQHPLSRLDPYLPARLILLKE